MSDGSMAENQRFKNHLCPPHQWTDYFKIGPQKDFRGSQFPDDKDKGGPWIIGLNEWMNGILVRALLGPIHLGLKTGPLCPMIYY
jgi:hypothetical protein